LSAGLAALLDDIAVLARAAAASVDDVGVAAAKAGAKAAGVVIDDAAVTPQYVRGLAAEREIPIVKRIAVGSLRNKFLIILPVILVLSQFFPGLLTPLLMIGGAYLCYEGAEKIWERIAHRDHGDGGAEERPDEKTLVAGAIRTDLILSAEIMVISLNQVASETFWSRLIILSIVAVFMTVLVYGAVGLIVKMDDVGLRLAEKPGKGVAKFGRGLVRAMPKVLTGLSVIGTAAMLWVGGHILIVGADDLGWHGPYSIVHHMEEAVHDATGALGGVFGWFTNTLASAVVGLVIGALIVAFMAVTFHRKSHAEAPAEAEAAPAVASPDAASSPEAVTPLNAGPSPDATPSMNASSSPDATPPLDAAPSLDSEQK
jgi:predicted DNA repair protein MutK